MSSGRNFLIPRRTSRGRLHDIISMKRPALLLLILEIARAAFSQARSALFHLTGCVIGWN